MQKVTTLDLPIYGHEVLSLLVSLGGSASREARRTAAAGRFGADARFCNCSGNRFSFDEVIEFLAARRKLAVSGDTISIGPVAGCGGH